MCLLLRHHISILCADPKEYRTAHSNQTELWGVLQRNRYSRNDHFSVNSPLVRAVFTRRFDITVFLAGLLGETDTMDCSGSLDHCSLSHWLNGFGFIGNCARR